MLLTLSQTLGGFVAVLVLRFALPLGVALPAGFVGWVDGGAVCAEAFWPKIPSKINCKGLGADFAATGTLLLTAGGVVLVDGAGLPAAGFGVDLLVLVLVLVPLPARADGAEPFVAAFLVGRFDASTIVCKWFC